MTKKADKFIQPSRWSVINFYFEILGKNAKRYFIFRLTIAILSFIFPLILINNIVEIKWPLVAKFTISTITFSITSLAFIKPFLKNKRIKVKASQKVKTLFSNQIESDPQKKDNSNYQDTVLFPSKSEQKNGYKRLQVPYRNDSIFISDEVNDFLRTDAAKNITLKDVPNTKSRLLKTLRPEANFYKDILIFQFKHSKSKGKMFFNDRKISLLSTLTSDTTSVDVFESSYYLSYLTNDLASKKVTTELEKGSSMILWSAMSKFPFVYDVSTKKNRMKSLEASNFSNHMGGNTIAFADNGEMILWQQSKSAQRSEDLIAPTGSGSLDFEDYINHPTHLFPMVIEGMERELSEESTTEGDELINLAEKTKIIGFYRWVSKAGLPGFLGVTKFKSGVKPVPNSSEVEVLKFEEQGIDLFVENAAQLIELIDALLHYERANLSVPLFANLKALRRVAEIDPDDIQFIFS